MRFNNYKSANKKYYLKKQVSQKSLHGHFAEAHHHGKSDWQFILTDEANNIAELCEKEMYWQYKLSTFVPNGLNERQVVLEII